MNIILLGFTGFCWVVVALHSFDWFQVNFPSFHGVNWILLDCIGFYLVILGLTVIFLDSTWFNSVFLGFTWFFSQYCVYSLWFVCIIYRMVCYM